MRVCIISEGSYPFITGGVSSWVHDIISSLVEIDFVIYAISPKPDQKMRYKLPPNVSRLIDTVVSEDPPDPAGFKPDKDFSREIMKFHRDMQDGPHPDIQTLFSKMPEDYDLMHHAIKDDQSWKYLTDTHMSRNPYYGFLDYYYGWKSAHGLLFNVLKNPPPEADIYHCVSTGFAGIAGLYAKLKYKRPMLLTEHGLYHKEREMEIRKSSYVKGYQRDMWIRFYNRLAQLAYSNSDFSTSLFEENRQKQIESGADPEKTAVLPNGIDVERFSSVIRRKMPQYSIGLVGRVVPIKDIKTYIAIARIVINKIPDARFYCIGPTDEDPLYYEECVKLVSSLGIEDRFEFTGRANVLEYYRFLDVMMLTSVREAQPLVILEGWAAGIPCVSTTVGNVPEMMDYDDRFLAAPRDAAALAERVIRLYRNRTQMAELNRINRRKVSTLYDRRQLHRKMRNIYTRLLEGQWQE